jgi:ubiquinone/menaquinone biosynthesis C-methylase UbiE
MVEHIDYKNLSDIDQPPSHEDSYYELRQRLRVKWILDNCEGKVLELGAGEGYIISHINCSGCVGIDWDAKRVIEGKKKYTEIKFYVLDVTFGLPFSDESFDTTMVPDMLEHLYFSDAKFVLQESLRVSKKKVLITMPFASDDEYPKELIETNEHKWIPSPERLSWLFKNTAYNHKLENGFVYIEVKKK